MVVIFGKEREHEETEHAGSRGTGKEEAQTQGHRSKPGLTVFEPNPVYFHDYLETYIGATWQAIKNSLYDAGYQALEVSRYRDGLLDDFNRICAENNYHGIV